MMLGWVAGVMTCVVMQAFHKAVTPREEPRHRIRRTLGWLRENAHRSVQNEEPEGEPGVCEAEAL